MKKVKITVLKTTLDRELAAEYGAEGLGPCPMMREGQVFYADYAKPEGLCDEAWKAIYQYVFALAHGAGEGLFYYGDWIRKPGVAICSCNDGLRPVIFKLEATDEEAVIDALVSGQMKHYVTDFPTPVIAGVKGAIVIPHLGASTGESEDNCARMAVRQLRDYLENGNITNSVNYPNCEMGRQANTTRIVLLHHNVPNMIGQFTKILARDNMNIADLSNKSKGEYAYTMIDIDDDVPESVADDLRKVGEVLRVRIIH